jgi:hypothetical protein
MRSLLVAAAILFVVGTAIEVGVAALRFLGFLEAAGQ